MGSASGPGGPRGANTPTQPLGHLGRYALMAVRWTEPEEKLDRLYQLIEDIEVAMLTTRRRDGSLVSRPMATQRRAEGAHLWFVTEEGSPKIEEIVLDPNVNLSYYKARTKEWVSVSGSARILRDRSKIRELYEPSWKVWFPDQGGAKNGGPDDPRILLIGVEARSAHFMPRLRCRRRRRGSRCGCGRGLSPVR